jgi:AraC-like DNA-binding protein
VSNPNGSRGQGKPARCGAVQMVDRSFGGRSSSLGSAGTRARGGSKRFAASGQDLTVEVLAERARMSPRNFARSYKEKTGRTSAKAVEVFRIKAAKATPRNR